jgi:hypothetical protein
VPAVSGSAFPWTLVSLIRWLTPPAKINESQRINEMPVTVGMPHSALLRETTCQTPCGLKQSKQ